MPRKPWSLDKEKKSLLAKMHAGMSVRYSPRKLLSCRSKMPELNDMRVLCVGGRMLRGLNDVAVEMAIDALVKDGILAVDETPDSEDCLHVALVK